MDKNWIKGTVVLDVDSLREVVREVVREELGKLVPQEKTQQLKQPERRAAQPRERRKAHQEAVTAPASELVRPKRRDDDLQFSARIRAARKARGWTRRDLATAVGIGRKSIINIESGLYPVGMKVRRRMEMVLFEGNTIQEADKSREKEVGGGDAGQACSGSGAD